MLSTAHHELGGNGPYKKTHVNHPCAVWIRQSTQHYLYVYKLMMNLGILYHARQNRAHKTILDHQMKLASCPPLLKDKGWTNPPQCMPEEYRCSDTVEAYQNYYEHKREVLNGS